MEPTGFAQKKTYGNSVKRDARSFSPIPPNNNGGLRSDLSRIDRMYQSNKKQKTSVSDSGPPKILSNKLVKIQKDYFTKYENLIKWEIEDQMKEIEQRISKWDRKRLMKEGVSLFDMKASFRGYLFNETLMSFRPISGEMPYHKFAHGDMVLISSPKNAAKPITFDGVIAEKTKTYITLATSYPIRTSDLEPGIWRLDQTANRVTFDRMLNALKLFTSSDGEKLTSFKDLILGNVKSIPDSAKQSPPMYLASSYLQSNWPRDFPTWKLNTSQRNVIKQALTRRLTIIQGPPGTGKTHTAVHLIKLIVYCLQRLNRKVHILCTADTNVAVDNLLEGLTDQGVRALRVGKPVKIREELRGLCLDAKLLEHDESSKVEKLREEMNTFMLQGNTSAANRIKSDIRSIETEISKDIMSNCEVICATCIGASAELLEGYKFPVVLIDECTQATEPAALCALVKGSEHVILLGDHFQLPPTVTSERAQKGGLSMSIFERLINQGVEPCLLQIQYRMHPAISEFPSREFYDNKITDGLSAEDRPMPAGFPWPNEQKPVSFIAMDEGEEQVSFDGLSKQNLVEAEKVIEVIDEFLQSGFTPKDIGIITPYNGQVQLLKNLLGTKGGTSKGQKYHKLTVHSVDGFQGREKEIIVFSAVRANKEKNVGFLRDWRRLNVALTRARRGIIILGHTETLSSDTHWNKWLHWIKDNHLQLHMNKMKEINTE